MKIVVLDGYTLNPGDLVWQPLLDLGECEIYDRTAAEQVLARAAGARAVLTNKTVLSRAQIEALPALEYIGVLATGVNVVDLAAARQRRITVTNVPAYSTASVAQMVFALLLEMTQQVGCHDRLVHEGYWATSPDFSFWQRPLYELDGLILGIVGFGAIGRRVATIAAAFGMKVQVHTLHPARYRGHPAAGNVDFVDLNTLFGSSDVVSLHCPLTADTEDLVDAKRLQSMKPSAFLINTGRGGLIDEEALAGALRQERIAGAGLDVLSSEPPPADHPLLAAPNCFITPHIAWATRAARLRLMQEATENLRAFLRGRPRNVVT